MLWLDSLTRLSLIPGSALARAKEGLSLVLSDVSIRGLLVVDGQSGLLAGLLGLGLGRQFGTHIDPAGVPVPQSEIAYGFFPYAITTNIKGIIYILSCPATRTRRRPIHVMSAADKTIKIPRYA